MKWLLVIWLLLPATVQSQEYKVQKRCMGGNNSAIVVEHHHQYYVVITPQFFQPGWVIVHLDGIGMGGNRIMHFFSGPGGNRTMQVQVLSRFKWRYAGFPGATSICRRVAYENLF